MPLENASSISQLDDRYPLASDPGSRGDDHLRLVKGVLKKQFPGEDGNGFKVPIALTEEFLNGLPAQLTKMQSDLDKRWPVGCALLLFSNQDPNADYPGVWQLVTGDATLSLGDGSSNVGAIAGNNNPTVPLPKHSHGATFTGNQLPPHNHDTYIYSGDTGAAVHTPVIANRNTKIYTSSNTAGTPSGTVTISDSGVDSPTIDVRGARIKVNVWKRVS